MKTQEKISMIRDPRTHNVENLASAGYWAHLGFVETPYGKCRVLFMPYDGHYMVHLDNLDVELFFHTDIKVNDWLPEEFSWKRFKELATADWTK